MAAKKYKPITPGLRHRKTSDFSNVSKVVKKDSRKLLVSKKNNAGRNSVGKITVRHRGGGAKRLYRLIDFKRDKHDVPAVVKSVEYDPNRNCNIALLFYKDGEKRYIIHPDKLSIGTEVVSGDKAPIKVGNHLSLKNIPIGSLVHNIELKLGKGGQLVRSAGASAVIMGRNPKYVIIKMPSGVYRLVDERCKATIGVVGNSEVRNNVLGKAGVSRFKRKRPTVRGSVMNPCDHPHGGGEGRAPIGQKHPRTPWGKPTLGYKTRKTKKPRSLKVIK